MPLYIFATFHMPFVNCILFLRENQTLIPKMKIHHKNS